MQKRREFIKNLTAGVMGISSAGLLRAQPVAGKSEKTNIIFILADDLGYGDLGCYGQQYIRTPNIDRLAAEGIRFTDHYAGSTVCAPSRCCLMTGLHTGHSYIRGNREIDPMGNEPLPLNTVTVAKLPKEAGYKTGLIGKWGLGAPGSEGVPGKQGFDYFYGYLGQRHAHNSYPEFLFRNAERIPLAGNRVAEPRGDGAGVAVEKSQYSNDLFAGEALSFIARNQRNPFYLYLSYTIPHANNEAGSEGMEVPSDAPYSNENWPQQQKNQAAMITRLDGYVGKLLDKLKELVIDDNTLVIFTSDNGPHRENGGDPAFFNSNGPLRGIKSDLYEGGIRVPLVARWPARIKDWMISNHISAFWDFLPTALDIAGATKPKSIDGISYLPALTGEKQEKHKYLYWEFHGSLTSRQAIRMGKWKALKHSPKTALEIYDLENDVGETNDLAILRQDIAGEALRNMESARTESGFWKLKTIPDEVYELHKLGSP